MSRWTADDRARAADALDDIAPPMLEVGSGYSPTPGYVHLDANENCPSLDWCGPADDLPWADRTFQEVLALDLLEHIGYRHTLATLHEWARVLVPGGLLKIQVPDAGSIMVGYARGPGLMVVPEFAEQPDIVSTAWRLLGGQDDGSHARPGDDWRAANVHLALFDEPALRWYAERAGFDVIDLRRNEHPNLRTVWQRR